MKNREFHALIRGLEWQDARLTATAIATAIGSTLSHVSAVLNNTPPGKGQAFGGRGGRTRKRIAGFLNQHWPEYAKEILDSLGWDEGGKQLATSQQFHREQLTRHNTEDAAYEKR